MTRGFTLIEVMVALLIAGLAIVALSEAARYGLRAAVISNETEEALSRARSRLDSVIAAGALQPLEQRGDDGGGFAWSLRIAPVATSAEATLFEVVVSVGWGSGSAAPRTATLVTRAIGPPVR